MPEPDQSRVFLEVSTSASGQRWVERLSARERNTATAISQNLDLPELVARVLAARGVSQDAAQDFLDPSLRNLMPDPAVLTDMEKATSRISDAIVKGQSVAIFGDYDVDGACASALMAKFLAHHGIKHEIYIPDRIFEGYGPNPAAINNLIENGAELIITVDCGATSFEALAEAGQKNIDVIVLDHHQMETKIPPSAALVNPNRQDDLSDLGYLCAAGVVFLTLVSVVRELRNRQFYAEKLSAPDLRNWLDLVSLATVCDVVPLKGLNRAFVVKGLQVMHRQSNIGLRELLRVARVDGPAKPYHLGFVLGPRINAGGRIGDASLGSNLLTTDDPELAVEISEKLEMLNQQRQKAEAVMLEQAIAEADAELADGEGPSVLITADDQWHPGIVGLLASRLKDRFQRPAFAIAFDRNGKGSGSGRSISGIDLGAAVRKAVEKGILDKGGGHAMAAGLTIQRDKLGALRGFFEKTLAAQVATLKGEQALKIDGVLTARSASLTLIDLLEQAGPFGSGHPAPVFAFPAHHIRYAKIVGRDHVSFTASAGDGASLRGIAFRAADTPVGRLILERGGRPLHLAGTLSADIWQGTRRVQLRLIDAAQA